VITKN